MDNGSSISSPIQLGMKSLFLFHSSDNNYEMVKNLVLQLILKEMIESIEKDIYLQRKKEILEFK